MTWKAFVLATLTKLLLPRSSKICTYIRKIIILSSSLEWITLSLCCLASFSQAVADDGVGGGTVATVT